MTRRPAMLCLLLLQAAAGHAGVLADAASGRPSREGLPLGPGIETHRPHSHAHEEIIVVVEGTIEVSIDGRAETVEAGPVIHCEPDKPHNLRNIGATPSRDYVIELRGRSG